MREGAFYNGSAGCVPMVFHNNTGDDYWPLIMRRSRMLNAGVDVNGFEPVSFEELVSNNAAFRQLHADTARSNPLTMFCAEA